MKNLDEHIKHDYRTEYSSAFALFWNMIRSFGPPEVVADFENFIKTYGIYPVDPQIGRSGPKGQYSVPINGTTVLFTNAHMSPPQGAFARNYARYGTFHISPLH